MRRSPDGPGSQLSPILSAGANFPHRSAVACAIVSGAHVRKDDRALPVIQLVRTHMIRLRLVGELANGDGVADYEWFVKSLAGAPDARLAIWPIRPVAVPKWVLVEDSDSGRPLGCIVGPERESNEPEPPAKAIVSLSVGAAVNDRACRWSRLTAARSARQAQKQRSTRRHRASEMT